jgi:hypothetical protein
MSCPVISSPMTAVILGRNSRAAQLDFQSWFSATRGRRNFLTADDWDFADASGGGDAVPDGKGSESKFPFANLQKQK